VFAGTVALPSMFSIATQVIGKKFNCHGGVQKLALLQPFPTIAEPRHAPGVVKLPVQFICARLLPTISFVVTVTNACAGSQVAGGSKTVIQLLGSG